MGSSEFILHLLEMTAIACHDIGAYLFNVSNGGFRPVKPTRAPYYVNRFNVHDPLPPTVFSYGGYRNVDDYPQGVADCAGYWVEFGIFGGVVRIDRGRSGDEVRFKEAAVTALYSGYWS
jgi:hypothetical protein